jgi:hypothetical protein
MVTFWATFASTNLLHFHLNKQYQNMVCCRYSKVDVLGFQIKPCCRYFGLLWLGDCFGYFLKNGAIFSNILVTLSLDIRSEIFF